MADLLINGKEYAGVNEVQIPLADGSGNQEFKEGNVFNDILTLIGTYDSETILNAEDSHYLHVIREARQDLIDFYNTLEHVNGGTWMSVLVTPVDWDSTLSEIAWYFVTLQGMNTESFSTSSYGIIGMYWNNYYGYSRVANGFQPPSNYTYDGVNENDIKLAQMTKASANTNAFPNGKVKIYYVSHPLS